MILIDRKLILCLFDVKRMNFILRNENKRFPTKSFKTSYSLSRSWNRFLKNFVEDFRDMNDFSELTSVEKEFDNTTIMKLKDKCKDELDDERYNDDHSTRWARYRG